MIYYNTKKTINLEIIACFYVYKFNSIQFNYVYKLEMLKEKSLKTIAVLEQPYFIDFFKF